MPGPRSDFERVDYEQPHFIRMRAILEAHPEIKQLFGPDSRIAAWTVALVGGQLALGACLEGRSFWMILVTAYVIGAVANHALWVVIHECAHRLVFRRALGNRLLCLLANWPQVVPGGIPFCKYHLLHHAYQGEQDFDGDLAGEDEARWVGNSTLRKALLMLLFSFVQGTIRPAISSGSVSGMVGSWPIFSASCSS